MFRLAVAHHCRFTGSYLMFWAIILVGILAGCGSSTKEFAYNGSGENLGFAPLSVAGQVLPGVPAVGVPVVITSEDGSVLAQATTDESGSFIFPGFAGPASFKVSATIEDGLVLENLVTNNTGGTFVVLNLPTTLASRLATANGLSPQEAKQQVANFLGLSGLSELEYGLSELNTRGFSHLVFFLRARQEGGVAALISKLVDQLVQGSSPQLFQPTIQDLDATLVAPQLLLEKFQRLQNSPALRQAIEVARLGDLPQIGELVLDGTVQAQPKPKAINAEIRALYIIDTLLDQAVDVAWTHIADGANLNYGTTAMLERIQGQLDLVLDALATITLTIDKNQLDQAVNTVYNEAISLIATYNSRLANLSLSTILANPETPYTPTDDTKELLSTLGSLSTEQSLRIIGSYLDPLGQGTKILVDGQSYILSSLYGQDLTADSGNFPFRNPDLYNQLFCIFEYYSQYQQLGINLLGETAHIQSNPTTALKAAQNNAEKTMASLYRQRAVLPASATLPPSVAVDIQGGLMWYTTILGEKSNSDAVAFANEFKLSDGHGGDYTDWHVPTLEEYRLLRERARLMDTSLRDPGVKHDGDNNAAGNFGFSAQGLTKLGFTNADTLNSDGSVLYSRYVLAQVSNGQDYYFLDGTSWSDPNYEFRFNHENSDERQTTSRRPFMLVRSIGKPVVRIDSRHDVDSTDADPPYKWSEVKDFEYEMLGRVSGIQNTHFLTPADSGSGLPDRVGADLTFSFATGGSFSVGGSPYALTFPRRVYDSSAIGASFPTYNGPSNAYTALNTRNQLVSFSSQNPKLEVTPTGRLRWRADGTGGFTLELIASFYDMQGKATDIQQNITTNISSPRKLVQIQMFPRNREYFLTSATSKDEQYYCLAFYSDDTVEDITAASNVVWSAVDNSTGDPLPSDTAFFSSQANGYFTVKNTAPQFIKLSVSRGSTSAENDQTVVKVVTQ